MNPLIFSVVKSALPYALAVAAGFGLAWGFQGLRLDAVKNDFSAYRNLVEQQGIEAQKAAIDRENKWRTEVENARVKAQAREAKLKNDVTAARAAANGLRSDLGALQARLASSSNAACLDAAASLGDLFAQCSEEYRAMAEIADRHVSDVRTLSEGWPK